MSALLLALTILVYVLILPVLLAGLALVNYLIARTRLVEAQTKTEHRVLGN